jgi:hypothetical protein
MCHCSLPPLRRGFDGNGCTKIRVREKGEALACYKTGLKRLLRLLRGEFGMKNPLDSLWGTVISGVVLTVIFFYVAQWLVVRTSAGG